MMVLVTKHGLILAQVEITVTFVHSPLKGGEKIYVQEPPSFKCKGDFVFRSNTFVHGK